MATHRILFFAFSLSTLLSMALVDAGVECADGSKTIRKRYQCDGYNDCPDGSDETREICGNCTSYEFLCASEDRCIPTSLTCDGLSNCRDGSDEHTTICGNCTSSEFACADGLQCIPASYKCDGRSYCKDGSDEDLCEEMFMDWTGYGHWKDAGRQFRGNGYVSIDHNQYYFNNERTTIFRLRFKTKKPTGLLFLTGNMTSNNFIALQLKDSILHYSYNLGGDTVTMFSPDPIHLNVWYMVEMKRIGNKGTLLVNGVEKDTAGTDDISTIIPDNMGDFYVGGYHHTRAYQSDQQTHFPEVTETLFTGCVKDFMLGSDYLFYEIKEQRNVTAGCKEEVENQV